MSSNIGKLENTLTQQSKDISYQIQIIPEKIGDLHNLIKLQEVEEIPFFYQVERICKNGWNA